MKAIRNEQGVALVLALGVLVVLTILGAAVLTTAGGSIIATVWDRSSNQAFHVAEAGFNEALYRARAGTLSEGTTTIDFANGQARVAITGVSMGQQSTWSIKSTGGAPSLDSPKARRAVEGRIIPLNAAEMYFVAGGAAGTILGNAHVDGPFYVRDYLPLSGSGGTIVGGPLYIKDNPATLDHGGDLAMTGNSAIGTAGNPIYAFIDGTWSKDASSEMYTAAIYSDVPDLDMPVINGSVDEMTAQRSKANLIIDGDSTAAPNGNYDGVYPGGQIDGLKLDKDAPSQTWSNGSYFLTWTKPGNPSDKTRTLAINGTIFVDGPVSIGSSQIDSVTFSGKGTIIANGNMAINSAFAPSPTSSFPATNAMGFVTPYQADMNPKANDSVYAVIYAYQRANFLKQFDFYGSVMTTIMDLGQNPFLHVVSGLGENVPEGMPPVQTTVAVINWREVPPEEIVRFFGWGLRMTSFGWGLRMTSFGWGLKNDKQDHVILNGAERSEESGQILRPKKPASE